MTEVSAKNVELVKERLRQAMDEKRKKLEKTRHREQLTQDIHKLKAHLNVVDHSQPSSLDDMPTAEERRINRIKQRFRQIKKLQKQQQREAAFFFACLPSCGAVEEE